MSLHTPNSLNTDIKHDKLLINDNSIDVELTPPKTELIDA